MTPGLLGLFLGFAGIAVLAFGGVLPWARYMIVDKRRWLTAAEFTDMLALCQLLPGPNIVNMSVAIGARFAGPAGSVASVLGLTVLPIAIVLALASVYERFAAVPVVGGALAGMAAGAAGLVVAMAVKIGWPQARARPFTVLPVVAATFLGIAILRLPLWPVIIVVAPLAILAARRAR